MYQLKEILLEGNKLEGHIPISLGNCNNLEYLDLCENKLTGHIPTSLGNCNNLEYLYLYVLTH